MCTAWQKMKKLLRAIQPAGVVPSPAIDPTAGVAGVVCWRPTAASSSRFPEPHAGLEASPTVAGSSAVAIIWAALVHLQLKAPNQGHAFSAVYRQSPPSTRMTVSQFPYFLKELHLCGRDTSALTKPGSNERALNQPQPQSGRLGFVLQMFIRAKVGPLPALFGSPRPREMPFWDRMPWPTNCQMPFCTYFHRCRWSLQLFSGSSSRATIVSWWPRSGWGGSGFQSCKSVVAACHGASQTVETSCHSWEVRFGTPTPVAWGPTHSW